MRISNLNQWLKKDMAKINHVLHSAWDLSDMLFKGILIELFKIIWCGYLFSI